MQFNWRNAEGTQQEKPKELDTTLSLHAVYVRKNIKQETKEQTDGNTVKVWTYKEAILTPKEYEQYQKELAECESMAQQELVDSNLVVMGAIADSTEMQITGEENQLIIMGAIADLYESIMDAIANIKTTS